ncbi:MAG: hypothetical protein P9M13_04430 [Candidatus Ancaeobacter aquaticus]|nr:hypothetical protein [Candidatus Ancaeobacter aquaticus]
MKNIFKGLKNAFLSSTSNRDKIYGFGEKKGFGFVLFNFLLIAIVLGFLLYAVFHFVVRKNAPTSEYHKKMMIQHKEKELSDPNPHVPIRTRSVY